MMIGIDLVYIPRIQIILDKTTAELFVRNVLSDREIALFYRLGDPKKATFLAMFFAIKEAVIKASEGTLSLANLNQIDISNDTNGHQIAVAPDHTGYFFVSTCRLGDYVTAVAVSSG